MQLRDISRPVWPLKFGVSASYRDTISPQAKTWQSHTTYKVLFRRWTTTKAKAYAMKECAYQLLGGSKSMLNAAYIDATEQFDVDFFAFELWCSANNLKISCMDDVKFDELLEEKIADLSRKPDQSTPNRTENIFV